MAWRKLRASARWVLTLGVLLVVCLESRAQPNATSSFEALLENSFHGAPNTPALELLRQSHYQALCSQQPDANAALEQERLAALQAVRPPAVDSMLGDWRRGDRTARNARGGQFDDPPGTPSGGNCYACHQLDPAEPAAGNLGPSLVGWLGRHGSAPDALRQTWIQLWDAQAVHACSVMPRFGARGILDIEQIRDLMGLLFDPESPVNRPTARP